MIYTSSYSNKRNHHGELASISLAQPYATPITLDFFKPTKKLLNEWKKSQQNAKAWKVYCKGYWELLERRRKRVEEWLDGLTSSDQITLLCYEKDDQYCHRQLVAKVIQKHRPEIFGGRDIPLFEQGDRVQHKTVDRGMGTVESYFTQERNSVYVAWDSGLSEGSPALLYPSHTLNLIQAAEDAEEGSQAELGVW